MISAAFFFLASHGSTPSGLAAKDYIVAANPKVHESLFKFLRVVNGHCKDSGYIVKFIPADSRMAEVTAYQFHKVHLLSYWTDSPKGVPLPAPQTTGPTGGVMRPKTGNGLHRRQITPHTPSFGNILFVNRREMTKLSGAMKSVTCAELP